MFVAFLLFGILMLSAVAFGAGVTSPAPIG